MKKILIIALMGIGLMASDVQAQQRVIPAVVPTVVATGEYNNGGSATTQNWATGLRLVAATATVTAAAPDSLTEKLAGAYTTVVFQGRGTRTGGRSDSIWMIVQACIDSGLHNTPTSYHSIDSVSFGNTATEQTVTVLVKAGAGNPYTHYRNIFVCRNLAASSGIAVRGSMLVKWKETEGWEMDGADVWADDRRQKLLW